MPWNWQLSDKRRIAMLDRFRVNNFKSLINVEFQPVGLNLLVGSNNAGKTNLCHALRFLGLTSRMSLDEATKHCTAEPWHLLNVYLGGDSMELEADCTLVSEGEQLKYSYSLRLASRTNLSATSSGPGAVITSGALQSSKPVTGPLVVSVETLKLSGGRFVDKALLINRHGKVTLLDEKRFTDQSQQGPEYVEMNVPPDATMLSRLFEMERNKRANLFKTYLSSWRYYNFDPSLLRSNVATYMDRVLDATGSNLSSVLYMLHNERPRDEKKLVEAAKLIEPRLDLISFHAPDPQHVYMFFEDKEGHRFGVQNLSDGTLRFLALCFLIIAHRRENVSEGTPPLIVIEEPENGVFVGHLKPLFEKIDPSGSGGQFIFSSHNPYFIDLFDNVLEGVHLIKAGDRHSIVTKPDLAKIRERLGEFSLGEMHFRGLLE
jgi:predicted ATPase